MNNLKRLEKEYIKKIRKGASFCVRKKYLYIFENEELIYKIPFSIHKYEKNGRYITYQIEVSIEGKNHIIASLQSEEGIKNLKTLINLINKYKKIKTARVVLENIEELEETLKKAKFYKKKKRG